ncbi:MAG: AMP-binding protein [Candidatus Tectimicrobiota bacterium]
MQSLVLHGIPYTRQHVLAGWLPPQATAYDRRVLHFCRQWLHGQEAFTLYTSGSTGEPKAIELSRAQMVTSARWTGQALGLQPGDRALVCLAVDYIAGMMMLVRGFELELALTVLEPLSRPLASCPPAPPFAFTAMVPLQVQETLQGAAHERALFNAMKGVLIGGAPVSLSLEEQLQQVAAPVYHTYGMTETVSHIALRRINGPQRSDCFVPFPEVCLGLDARGCLTITAPVTRGEMLCTNDLVELRPDGTFRWLGRIDNVVNSGGVKVHIERVERALEAWLMEYQQGRYAARRFFVGALPHARLGQAVVAVLEVAGGEDLQAEAALLRHALRSQPPPTLDRYEIPRQVFVMPQFRQTSTGKVDRRAILQDLAAQRPALP